MVLIYHLKKEFKMVWTPKSKITKVNLSWIAIISTGILSFVLAKRSVDRNRLEIMRSKQRVKDAVQKNAEEKFSVKRDNN